MFFTMRIVNFALAIFIIYFGTTTIMQNLGNGAATFGTLLAYALMIVPLYLTWRGLGSGTTAKYIKRTRIANVPAIGLLFISFVGISLLSKSSVSVNGFVLFLIFSIPYALNIMALGKKLTELNQPVAPHQVEPTLVSIASVREQEINSVAVDQPKRSWVIALVVVCLGIIAYGYLIGYSQQKNAATQAITEIQKDYSSITRSATDAQGLPQRVEGQLDTTPKTKGEFGEVERFMKTIMNKTVSQRNDYFLEVDAIGWDKILDPERVKQDKALIESKMMVQKAKDIVSKYRTKTYVLLENARKDIGNLNVSENLRREWQVAFDSGMAESRSQVDAFWDLEAKTISEVENIIALLAARKGAWVVQKGQILFASDSDLNTFNAYVTAIQELVAKQEVMQKQSVEAVNNNLNRLKN